MIAAPPKPAEPSKSIFPEKWVSGFPQKMRALKEASHRRMALAHLRKNSA